MPEMGSGQVALSATRSHSTGLYLSCVTLVLSLLCYLSPDLIKAKEGLVFLFLVLLGWAELMLESLE